MKNILSIIVITLLFLLSGLIFWAGLSPVTFSKFFPAYQTGINPAIKVNLIIPKGGKLTVATSSEPVSSAKGQVIINNNSFEVETALTDREQVNGLSNRQVLKRQQGMLFVFAVAGTQYFWMKDMLFSLDMIFFDENWKIVLIEKNLTPQTFPKTFGGNVKSKYVLEINAGESDSFGLAVGQQGIFLNK